MKADVLGVGEIEVEFDVTFSGDQLTRLEKGQDYQIFVHLQKNGQTVDTGSKTKVPLDINIYDKNADVFGLFGLDRHEQFPHPYDFVDRLSSTGFTNAKLNVEEGVLTFGYFWLDTSLNAFLETLDFTLNTYNTVSGAYQEFRRLSIDLSDQVIVDGKQQIELDSTRGYLLKENDQFNYLKIITGDLVGDKQYYEVLVGWKTPFQSWLEYSDADPVFYDRTKSFNGLNQFAANYSNSNDYQLRTFIEANVSNGEAITNYVHSSENIEVWGYDEDDQGSPDTYLCAVNTYNISGVVLENNIINNEFTEVRGEFTPNVPPVFTIDVDMTEVATLWNRFSHGNKSLTATSGRLNGNPQLDVVGSYANNQAGIVDGIKDTMWGGGLVIYDKDAPELYTSTPTTIFSNQNIGAYYGCYSIDQYEYYSITGKMFSTGFDNDAISFVLAFHVDSEGVEHTISLVATTGGILLDRNPAYTNGDYNIDIFSINPPAPDNVAAWALVYNFGKDDMKQLDIFRTIEPVAGWDQLDPNTETFEFSVNRSSDDFEVVGNWNLPTGLANNTFNYNLLSDPLTEKFAKAQSIGFSFNSQSDGGFKDVKLINPSGDYYGILRILPENSPSDQSMIELKFYEGSTKR